MTYTPPTAEARAAIIKLAAIPCFFEITVGGLIDACTACRLDIDAKDMEIVRQKSLIDRLGRALRSAKAEVSLHFVPMPEWHALLAEAGIEESEE
jgi:hypothetical protein